VNPGRRIRRESRRKGTSGERRDEAARSGESEGRKSRQRRDEIVRKRPRLARNSESVRPRLEIVCTRTGIDRRSARGEGPRRSSRYEASRIDARASVINGYVARERVKEGVEGGDSEEKRKNEGRVREERNKNEYRCVGRVVQRRNVANALEIVNGVEELAWSGRRLEHAVLQRPEHGDVGESERCCTTRTARSLRRAADRHAERNERTGRKKGVE